MIDQLLSPHIQLFIEQHQRDDPNDLRLKYKTIFDIPANIVIDQITGRKKAKEKLPTWSANKRIIYPPSLNLEQSSSERTALMKKSIVESVPDISSHTAKLLDLTGGFGVDSLFLSKVGKELHFVEPDENLLAIAKHNHRQLGAANIHYHNTTAETFFDSIPHSIDFDLVYIDPSRRSESGRKVLSLYECEPDVLKLLPKIFTLTNRIMLKTSPLLDIKLALSELRYVQKVYVIAVFNECKELLFLCGNENNAGPAIEALNLADRDHSFSFTFSEEEDAVVTYSDPKKYLFEPNASILKSGAFKTIAARFEISKLHPNTHLYTADRVIADFPGRTFKIESSVKSNPKELENLFVDSKANILTRNYPLSVAELRQKTRLKEGGDKFLIGCSGLKNKFLLVASRSDSL
ncbi:MAG TPA: RsmD family RNA methyltransferase [Chryseolinea sp.]